MLGSVDIEEKERADRVTERRRSMLGMRIKRSIERRDNERIRNNERIKRVIEQAKRALYGDSEVRPVCIICRKINSRTFKNEDERRLHTGAEVYDTFWGQDYEKEMRAAVERAVDWLMLNNFDRVSKIIFEMEDIKKGPFWTNWTVFMEAASTAEDAIMSVSWIYPRWIKC